MKVDSPSKRQNNTGFNVPEFTVRIRGFRKRPVFKVYTFTMFTVIP